MSRSENIEEIFRLAIRMQSTLAGVTISDIQKDCHVSRRTAERYLEIVGNAFPVLEQTNSGEKQKRWRLNSPTLHTLVKVKESELSALQTVIKLARRDLTETRASELNSLYDKLLMLMDKNNKRVVEPDIEAMMEAEGLAMRPGPRLQFNTKALETIREAILARLEVKISYTGNDRKKRVHTVQPYGLLYGHRHYLVGRLKGKKDYVLFKLDGISLAQLCASDFEYDSAFSIKHYAENSFGAYQEEPFDVEWIFHKAVAEQAAEYLFHTSQKVEKLKNGQLSVKFRAGGELEMAWHLYKWGKYVTVIKPKDFWKRVEKIRKEPVVP